MGVHAQRGARIAYIDMNVILSKNKEFITANRILDEKIAQWKKEIELKKIQLKRIEDQFDPNWIRNHALENSRVWPKPLGRGILK